jgi:hypothetical protein
MPPLSAVGRGPVDASAAILQEFLKPNRRPGFCELVDVIDPRLSKFRVGCCCGGFATIVGRYGRKMSTKTRTAARTRAWLIGVADAIHRNEEEAAGAFSSCGEYVP